MLEDGNTLNGVHHSAAKPERTVMARLTHQQTQKLVDCLGELYAHHDLDSFARRVTELGRKAVGADWAACDEVNYFTEHPFVKYLRQNGDVPPLRFSDLINRQAYHETTLYHEAYRRFGVEYQLGFTLPSPAPGFVHDLR